MLVVNKPAPRANVSRCTRLHYVALPERFVLPPNLGLTSSGTISFFLPQSAGAKGDDDEDLDPETDALTDFNTQDTQNDRGTARPSVSSTRGNR